MIPMSTLVIDNFQGAMTSFQYGDINSGRSFVQSSSGANPFIKPHQLTWNNAPVLVSGGEEVNVVSDLILAGKERVEDNVIYVYCIGHTGNVYKIQVNDPVTFNPDYDNPVLLTTLTVNSPTFTRGGFLDFFGSNEKIYISHDKGVTSLNFDGSNETFVGSMGSWTQNVPKPLKQFVGKMYVGNGENLAEIDSTETVTTYTKLSPGFPTANQVRDIDVSPEGTYLEVVVSRLALENILATTQNTSNTSNSDSYIFKWNGTDVGYTAFSTFPSFSLTANIMFQNYQYTFGYDQYGAAMFNPNEKQLTLTELQSPLPNAIINTGNILNFMSPVYYNGVLEADFFNWGNLDWETGHPGWWNVMFLNATQPQTDITLTPWVLSVSNAALGSSTNGYMNNIYGTSKIYFSTLETNDEPSSLYRFYKWSPTASPQIPATSPITYGAVYQTQTQMFSKKISISEVRTYAEPWATDNAFTIDLIGSDGGPITGGSYTFTAETNSTGIANEGKMIIGDDFAWYSPNMKPTYALGLSITNVGSTNHVINKVEIDYSNAGK